MEELVQSSFKYSVAEPPNRSPLRGIREQENEDYSEFTYRASNIFLTEEKNAVNQTFEAEPINEYEEEKMQCMEDLSKVKSMNLQPPLIQNPSTYNKSYFANKKRT